MTQNNDLDLGVRVGDLMEVLSPISYSITKDTEFFLASALKIPPGKIITYLGYYLDTSGTMLSFGTSILYDAKIYTIPLIMSHRWNNDTEPQDRVALSSPDPKEQFDNFFRRVDVG